MKTPDSFRKQWSCRQNIELVACGFCSERKAGTESVTTSRSIGWIGKAPQRAPCMNRPCRHQRHDAPGSRLAGRAGGTQQRSSGAYQIVDHKRRCSCHLAHEEISATRHPALRCFSTKAFRPAGPSVDSNASGTVPRV